MRRLLFPILALVLLVGGAAGGYFLGNYLHPPPVTPVKVPEPVKSGPPDADRLYDVPDMLVALPGDDNNNRFLSVSISVECPSQADLDKLQSYLPRLLDAFQSYLSNLSIKDIRGTKNLAAIKSGLMERANSVIAPARISAVLIRQMSIR